MNTEKERIKTQENMLGNWFYIDENERKKIEIHINDEYITITGIELPYQGPYKCLWDISSNGLSIWCLDPYPNSYYITYANKDDMKFGEEDRNGKSKWCKIFKRVV